MNALRTIFLFSAVVLGAVALSAAPKPDFTGTWKLNLEKSDLGGIPISALVVSIQHKDPEFKYNVKGTVNGEDVEESETFTTDGTSSQDSRGNTVTSHWDAAVLVSDVVAPTAARPTPQGWRCRRMGRVALAMRCRPTTRTRKGTKFMTSNSAARTSGPPDLSTSTRIRTSSTR